MVGIWGTGGIGKTTIAKAVYNSIAHMFEGSFFLANVREESQVHGGLLTLQNILLSKILGGKELKVINVDEGITLLRERLRHKRILLVLDDVNKRDQLDKLAGATDWFGRGSRIIITTRDKHLLIAHQVNSIYKAWELDPHESRELFISNAFKNKTNLDDIEKLSVSSVVKYAQGLPLALDVLGSHLCDTPIHKWQAILDGCKRSPLRGIRDILKISYDALENPEKEVFLDLACFYKGWHTDDVIQILEGCDRINPEHSIQVLEKKALINVMHMDGRIWMHDLLEEMGKEIVHQESPKEPGERSRLWYHKDVHDVLTENIVLRWRTSLTEAANLSGWHFSDGYESKFIHEVVEEISLRVKENTYLNVANHPIGLESRVQHVLERFDVGGSDIRMVGIWGTGGIGKTTIAKAVYNSIAHMFEGSCFLANVREESQVHGGLLTLQNILLSKILGGKELKVINVDEGITLLRERLRHKRILLVLDDVNKRDQLDKLAGATDWFGRGSRIIITTRDKHLLIAHQVNSIYKAWELDPHESRELFISNAFKNKTNLDDIEELSVSSVVEYAQGLPLALDVLGSHLCDTPIHKWQAILDGCKRSPLRGIRDILKISYDALENPEKEVFLDLACFYKGWHTDDVIQILEGCDRINPEHSIQVLEKKALINVMHMDGRIWMHDLLEEMGKEIVHQESPKEPGERSRLWYHKDVHDVLTENIGTSKIEGIMVKLPTTDEIHLSPKCFKKMKSLKIFINDNARFCGKVNYLPEQLRLLDWPEYPLQSLPSNFNTKKLVQLNMPRSRISRLVEGFKRLENLKSMNFMGCEFLTEIPNLSGCPNLERMDLWWCKSLVEIHPSVGFLEKLVHLNLEECSNLVKLPRKVNWRCLSYLNLNFCCSLESFPEIVGEMKCLIDFYLVWCSAIKELPSSIGYMINLERLYLFNCENLTNLPCSIYQLQNLKKVGLYGCPKLITFPNKVNSVVLMPTSSKEDREFHIRLNELEVTVCSSLSDCDFLESLDCASTLKTLDLSAGSNIASLSECLCKFTSLRELDLGGCRNLVEIPQLSPCIKHLDVRDCVSLERISKFSKILEREESQMIEKMNLSNCWKLIKELVKEANVLVNDDYEAPFRLFLSCQQSKFTVRFPGSEIPKWFSCQMDFQGLRRFEFFIEILPNFKWENTGLALCVTVDQNLQNPYFEVIIHINDIRVSPEWPLVNSKGSDHVWLQYILFREMWPLGYMHPLPPFMCRVIIYPNEGSLKSCGVHLVMPPNEDVCMKLSRGENLTSILLPQDIDEDDEDRWEKYRPK